MTLKTIDFGTEKYRDIWIEQRAMLDMMVRMKLEHDPIIEEFLLLGEHEPVYTLGFHGDESNLIAPVTELESQGVECIRVERGGDITYHGPGQLIAYPIIDLENHKMGVKGYVDTLQDCVIELLGEYGIKGDTVEGATGVWIDAGTDNERKICAIGIKCSRFITMHGLALNVNTDLDAFSKINPCGFTDKGVTSVEKETGKKIDLQKVKDQFDRIFRLHFGFTDTAE